MQEMWIYFVLTFLSEKYFVSVLVSLSSLIIYCILCSSKTIFCGRMKFGVSTGTAMWVEASSECWVSNCKPFGLGTFRLPKRPGREIISCLGGGKSSSTFWVFTSSSSCLFSYTSCFSSIVTSCMVFAVFSSIALSWLSSSPVSSCVGCSVNIVVYYFSCTEPLKL